MVQAQPVVNPWAACRILHGGMKRKPRPLYNTITRMTLLISSQMPRKSRRFILPE